MLALADLVVDVGVIGGLVVVAVIVGLVVAVARRGVLVRIRHEPPDDEPR